MRHCQYSI